MTRRPAMVIGALAAVLLIAVAATWLAARRQQRDADEQVAHLRRSGAQADVRRGPSDIRLDELPAPVARYLRMALPTATYIEEVRLRQTGTLRTDVNSERWMPFEAEHIAVPSATGFVWNARVGIAPLLHVRVRDALIEGRGSGHVSLLSAFTVSTVADTPEMDSGALHRYLAEAVWYPTALLPGPQLTWTAIDEAKALATLTHAGTTVSLEFRFAESGEVTGIYTPGRWGTFPGGYQQVPWEGHFRGYRERGGVVTPTEGDVGWYVDGEWRAVWKGIITAIDVRTTREG